MTFRKGRVSVGDTAGMERQNGPEKANLPVNFVMAAVTGLFWYGQFFFYNLGHVRMGPYKFTSWAIHMIMLVLISNLVGLLLREWRRCRELTHFVLATALTVLVAAVLLLTYGNYVGDRATKPREEESASRAANASPIDGADSSHLPSMRDAR